MKIPAKTFFLGEYAALFGAPALLLTTTPCFEMQLIDTPELIGIHPLSPAAIFWKKQEISNKGLHWHDPYHEQGGLGASSGQFLGAYTIRQFLIHQPTTSDHLLEEYMLCAWPGIGIKPSGYDVIAQSMQQCVFVHGSKARSFSWPFSDIGFILLHTGKKLSTHEHLQSLEINLPIDALSSIVASAQIAFETSDSDRIIEAVNTYHSYLLQGRQVANHSLELIEQIKRQPDVLAIKGCGAMGSDVLLILVPNHSLNTVRSHFLKEGLSILATHEQLFSSRPA